MKNGSKIGVLTSGGDSPGMNAAIRAVVRSSAYHNIPCMGIYQGYYGLINNIFEDLKPRSVRNIINKGGTILKSARSKEFRTKEGRARAYKNLIENNVSSLVIIGGDGSLTGANIFCEEYPDISIVGIPGTIDNDIFGTDYTVGFDTAINTVVEAIDKIRDTASSHNRLFFIEVMGRDAGHIALNCGIGAGAEEILIPEEDLGFDRLVESLEKSNKSGKSSSIVVVAEGDNTGENVFSLAKQIEENMDRYEIRVSVLGHMQRGGAPSCFDRVLASRMGVKAVEFLIEGVSKKMIGINNQKISLVDFESLNKEKRTINKELLRISEIVSI